jgi:hypothetical protein
MMVGWRTFPCKVTTSKTCDKHLYYSFLFIVEGRYSVFTAKAARERKQAGIVFPGASKRLAEPRRYVSKKEE